MRSYLFDSSVTRSVIQPLRVAGRDGAASESKRKLPKLVAGERFELSILWL